MVDKSGPPIVDVVPKHGDYWKREDGVYVFEVQRVPLSEARLQQWKVYTGVPGSMGARLLRSVPFEDPSVGRARRTREAQELLQVLQDLESEDL